MVGICYNQMKYVHCTLPEKHRKIKYCNAAAILQKQMGNWLKASGKLLI